MSNNERRNNNANFIWNIADHLRGTYKATDYAKVVLPFTILRRMDCILEPTKDAVVEASEKYADKPEGIRENLILGATRGLKYYNTSPYTLTTLLDDSANLAENLLDYVGSFSDSVRDIFSRFRIDEQIRNLNETGLLYLTLQKYASEDFSEEAISNHEMGLLFEELIRKFAEDSAADNGEFFTPRDAIELLVQLLFAPQDEELKEGAPIRSIYDPTAGTGGMISIAAEHMESINPNAELNLFGQELNPESYAICKSDMLAKGQEVSNIRLGNTLNQDKFPDEKFDFVISNPPYGSKWETEKAFVEKEHKEKGFEGRFGPGLPASSDGQLLFLLHAVSKLRKVNEDGSVASSRAGVVLNGSSLFSGDAGSGASNIRRWLFESDYVDAIVALPTNMFYSTGIATYMWMIDVNKPEKRKGKVQLIDATSSYKKMRKSLGGKTRMLSSENIEGILNAYKGFEDVRVPVLRRDPVTGEERLFEESEVMDLLARWGDFNESGELTGVALEGQGIVESQELYRKFFESHFHISKIFNNEDFGFRVVTVEQPLIGLYQWNADSKERLQADARFLKWTEQKQADILNALDNSSALTDTVHENRNTALNELGAVKVLDEKTGKQKALTKAEKDVIMDALLVPASRGKEGEISYIDNNLEKGFYIDKELTDTETIPLSENVDEYIEREVKPFAPHAYVDENKTKIGYEIPFNRHFYKAEVSRSLDEIQDELTKQVRLIAELLGA